MTPLELNAVLRVSQPGTVVDRVLVCVTHLPQLVPAGI